MRSKGSITPPPALPPAGEGAPPVTALSVPEAVPPGAALSAAKAPPLAAVQPVPGVPLEVIIAPPAPSHPWREPTRYVVGVGLFLAMLALLWLSRSVISTLIVAALLTVVVQPVIRFLERRLTLSRGLSISITYLVIVALLILIPLLVIPSLVDTFNALIGVDWSSMAEAAAATLEDLSTRVSQIPVLNALLTPLLDSLAALLTEIPPDAMPEPVTFDDAAAGIVDQLAQTLGTLAKILGPIVSAIVAVVFMLLISFHLSLSGQRLLQGYPRLIPLAYQGEITSLVRRIQQVWQSFLRGQFTLMVMVGAIVALGNALLGNRHALLLGFISGILEIIPNLGPALALIPGVLMALLFGSSHFDIPNPAFAVVVLIFYLLVQVAENQLIVPYVLGGELEVPALMVIVGIMIGGSVTGILGVLLAVPIMATGRELFMYLYEKILPLPEVDEPPKKKGAFLDAVRGRLSRVKLPTIRRHKEAPAPEAAPVPEP